MSIADRAKIPGQMDGSVVDGLFVRALKAHGALAEELRGAGIDVGRLEPHYSPEVFHRGLDVASAHLYSGLPLDEAHCHLGQRALHGFLETPVGKVLGMTLQLLPTDRLLSLAPRFLAMGKAGVQIASIAEGPASYRLDFREDVHPVPFYVRGLIIEAARVAGPRREIQTEVTTVSLDAFNVRLWW